MRKKMIKSMTGYGWGGNKYFTIEIQSWNYRYLTIDVKLPEKLLSFESKIKEFVKNRVQRGKVSVIVRDEGIRSIQGKIGVDLKLAQQYLQALRELSTHLGIQDDIRLSHLLRFNAIFYQQEPIEERIPEWNDIKEPLSKALDSLIKMRKTEGKALYTDIAGRIKRIGILVKEIEIKSKELLPEYKKRLTKRISDIVGENNLIVDPRRLAIEVAFYTDKIDISEELARLMSHLSGLKKSLLGAGVLGRQLDFLLQELNREANTVCSKTDDIRIINYGVEMKSELEKIREQIQNIE